MQERMSPDARQTAGSSQEKFMSASNPLYENPLYETRETGDSTIHYLASITNTSFRMLEPHIPYSMLFRID